MEAPKGKELPNSKKNFHSLGFSIDLLRIFFGSSSHIHRIFVEQLRRRSKE